MLISLHTISLFDDALVNQLSSGKHNSRMLKGVYGKPPYPGTAVSMRVRLLGLIDPHEASSNSGLTPDKPT